MKEPKIRFKGFKGEWEKKKLGAMTSVRGGYAFQSSLFQKYGIPVVRISNILSNGNVGGDFVYYPRLDGDTNITIHEKDVVIAMSGATTGKIARVDVGDGILYQNQRVGLFTKTGKVDYDFLYTVLNRPHFNELLNKLLTSSAQPNASSADIESIEMEFPEDAEEQKALSNYILSLDSLIQSTTKKIESLKQVKAASLQSMFPQEGETVPKLRFKGFEGDWEKVNLGEILTYEQPTKYLISNTDYKKNGTPVLTAGKTFILGYTSETSGIYTNLPVIIFDDFTTESKFVDFQFKAKSSAMKMLRPVSDLKFDIKFVYEVLKNIHFRVENHQRHWLSVFSKITVMMPSFAEQRAIASFFTILDRKITLQSQQLEKLKQIKAACLDKMFV